jgi:nitrite reductase (NO-forming)/hydroxylamine reductase
MRSTIRVAAIAAVLALPAGSFAQDAKLLSFFKETCGACHGEAGEGLKGLAPPLKGNAWVKGASEADLANVITKGRAGDAKLHKDLPSPMPPASMSAGRLKALIAYLKGDLQK